eukprot:Clim_evm17s208 gene=Clim_evmTU17s208
MFAPGLAYAALTVTLLAELSWAQSACVDYSFVPPSNGPSDFELEGVANFLENGNVLLTFASVERAPLQGTASLTSQDIVIDGGIGNYLEADALVDISTLADGLQHGDYIRMGLFNVSDPTATPTVVLAGELDLSPAGEDDPRAFRDRDTVVGLNLDPADPDVSQVAAPLNLTLPTDGSSTRMRLHLELRNNVVSFTAAVAKTGETAADLDKPSFEFSQPSGFATTAYDLPPGTYRLAVTARTQNRVRGSTFTMAGLRLAASGNEAPGFCLNNSPDQNKTVPLMCPTSQQFQAANGNFGDVLLQEGEVLVVGDDGVLTLEPLETNPGSDTAPTTTAVRFIQQFDGRGLTSLSSQVDFQVLTIAGTPTGSSVQLFFQGSHEYFPRLGVIADYTWGYDDEPTDFSDKDPPYVYKAEAHLRICSDVTASLYNNYVGTKVQGEGTGTIPEPCEVNLTIETDRIMDTTEHSLIFQYANGVMLHAWCTRKQMNWLPRPQSAYMI